MAICAVCSASGSRGVTTICLGLSLSWPRPVVLVEADPTGGSAILAGYFRGRRDDDGLIDLVAAARQGQLAQRLPELLIDAPGSDGRCRILVGSRAHEQAVGLSLIWDDLLAELKRVAGAGQDVIVDAGRLGLEGSPAPLINGADVTLLTTGTSLPELTAAVSWARTLQGHERPGHAVLALLVGEGQPYTAREVRAALGLPLAGSIADDPLNAQVLSHGEPFPPAAFWRRVIWREQADERRFADSALMRSITALGERLRGQAASTGPETLSGPAQPADTAAAGDSMMGGLS